MTDFQIYQLWYLFFVTVATLYILPKYKIIKNAEEAYSNMLRTNNGYALFITIVLLLLIGLRPEDGVFIDSLNYKHMYDMYYDGVPFEFDVQAENVIFDNLLALWGSLSLGCGNFFFLVAIAYFLCIYYTCKRLFPNDILLSVITYFGAFSTYSYSCNGIKAGVAASVFLLALSYRKNWRVVIPLLFLSLGLHHSMKLPIAAYVLCVFYTNSRYYMFGWLMCLLVAMLHITFFQELLGSLSADNGDAIGAQYLSVVAEEGWGGKSGFRYDFVLYSVMPIIVGYYAIYVKKIKSELYSFLLNFYLTTNGAWLVCMYVQYSNRIAYLSWFVYPILLIYPFLKEKWSQDQYKQLSKIVSLHLAFTLFMAIIYYR